ncbi:MAG: hypothetical protein AAF725_11030 [Acidobacteriota bacterium]
MNPDTEFSYSWLPGVGDQETPATSSFLEFVRQAHGLLYLDYIPTFAVFNDFLAQGIADQGMSGGVRWDPLVVERACYDSVREALLSDERLKLIEKDAPGWITTYDEWSTWVYCDAQGVDFFEEYPLKVLDRLWDGMMFKASRAGRQQLTDHFLAMRVSETERYREIWRFLKQGES